MTNTIAHLADQVLPRVAAIASALTSADAHASALAAARHLERQFTTGRANSAEALQQLPSALADCEDTLTDPGIRTGGLDFVTLAEHARALVDIITSGLAAFILHRRGLGSGLRPTRVGSGCHNWAVGDGRRVVLLSKGRDRQGFDTYRLRHVCARSLKAQGLDQPGVSLIGRLPVLHAICDHSPGTNLGAIWPQRRPGRDSDANRVLTAALSKLGALLHTLVQRPITGFGPLVYAGALECRGQFADWRSSSAWLWRQPLQPQSGAPVARILSEGILSARDLRNLAGFAAAAEGFRGPAILAHMDLNASNITYDPARGTVGVLDWDGARAAVLPEFVAQLYKTWVMNEELERWHSATWFETILVAMEPGAERRGWILRQALMLLALERYAYVRQLLRAADRTGSESSGEPLVRPLRQIKNILVVLAA